MEPDPPNPSRPALPAGHPGAEPAPRFRPALFFGFLFGPPLLTMLVIAIGGSDSGLAAAMVTAIGGSLLAGLVCGIHFAACQRTLSTGGKVGAGIAMAIGCGAVSFALSFGGCLMAAGMMESFRH